MISNSDLLSETTNSELHKKYLEDQRLAQMELAEFENIERQIDKFPVSPLLMSRDFKSETVKDQFQSRKFDEEDVNDEIINSEWSNKPAEYYMGQDTSSVESHEYHSEDENPESYNYAHHNQESHIDDDSDRDVSESENAFSSHENELEEAASMALVAESQFIRVSQSQNPFHPSNISQNSIDDSVSWGNAPQTAIRPRLSTESDHFNGTPVKSQISIAPTRYQTSHHSFGAIGEESDWDKKRISPKKRTVSPNHRSLSAGRKVVNNAPSVETSKSKIITDNDVLAKAKKLEEEIAVYQSVFFLNVL